ncbi:MAG: peptide-methionine (S)-S-oxide reductase MsrA [Proteobacteria bacterium]|jgi:methionine-S-sulfoxide reductase|nr:peptide-methionine (S)-S-oxide reductase MsrA [Pseudomonadota bacterium]
MRNHKITNSDLARRYAKMIVLFTALFWALTAFANTETKGKPMGTEETAILAGGCFWGVEDLLRKVKGIKITQVGYTGGETENPTYLQVKTGQTGHAEAVEIKFNPEVITYGEILNHFFSLHDPTTRARQGNDVGTQYRSAIFYLSSDQRRVAQEKIHEWQKKWKNTIVTEVVPATKFYSAEEYHQDYLVKNPNGYTCHYYRTFD